PWSTVRSSTKRTKNRTTSTSIGEESRRQGANVRPVFSVVGTARFPPLPCLAPMVASARPAMSVEAHKEIEDFFRSMRLALNGRDIKAYRSHFWTDKRFVHFDASGRIDEGWGAYEEFLDQEFRYMEVLKLELRDMEVHTFGDDFAIAYGQWRLQQIDAGGREQEAYGRATFTLHRMGGDWKIVN